ncbi:Ig-like domain-containing protein [Shewanella morhuae]|uniref:Ig-like domain-containing protein n=1 Tax=Shewanella morhuae TaxID=365591 RepID=UPI001BB8E5FC|nr:Ig-like domain-containing protein [Shewanella morhuae]GIU11872.1 hypothetical protein TUM4641_30390 [Shewanella morhuae]
MKSAYKVFLAGMCSLFLFACGGGGSISDDGTGNGTEPKLSVVTVTLSISNTDISAAVPATVSAKVVDSKLGALANKLVIFSLDDSALGVFQTLDSSASNGAVVTDANGIASLQLLTAKKAGGGVITAKVASGEYGDIPFIMKGDGGDAGGGPQITLTLTDAAENPIDSIASTTPGILTATVTGITKTSIVTFDATTGDLPVKTAITDANGKASVNLYAGSTFNAGTAKASLSTGEFDDLAFAVGATNVLIGSGSPFISGKADVSALTLSAGGTATISILLQDDKGNPFTEPVDVRFASTCSNKATPEAIISSPITAIGGQATSTYLAKGCAGVDNITVTADVGGKNLSATGSINVLSASVGSIVFVDATPENIGIKGTGTAESSTLRFRVLDTNGNAVANKTVDFKLNNDSAGLGLTPSTATSNSQGYVQTVVNSGTVATTVRVTATILGINGTNISSQSNVLVVSTGKPDQDSFSLSASALNVEGWNYDGAKVTITARLADAFNNPVPDGTAVVFTTEGGSIESSCQTKDGVCSVTWTSQNPRPESVDNNGPLFNISGIQTQDPNAALKLETNLAGASYNGNHFGQPYGGRVTITATAIGEESFPDLNSNNILDTKKEFDLFVGTPINCGRDNSGDCYDLTEAFVDHNEDGIYTPAYPKSGPPDNSGDRETFIDFIDPVNPTGQGVFNLADGEYSGILCDSSAADVKCSQQVSISVRRSLVLVMSGSEAIATQPTNVIITDNLSGNNQIDIALKGTASVIFTISDINNQQMPAGTTVSFNPTGATLTSSEKYTWPSTNYNGGRQFVVSLKGGEQADSGNLIVTVTTPGEFGIPKTTTEVLNIPIVVK